MSHVVRREIPFLIVLSILTALAWALGGIASSAPNPVTSDIAVVDAGAHPMTPLLAEVLDAGVDNGIGTSPAVAPPQTGIGTSPVDPVADPGGAAHEIQHAFGSGTYALGVIMVLLALSRLSLAAAKRWDLGKLERATPYVVTGSGVLVTLTISLSSSGAIDWRGVLGALAAAAALYLSPAKKVPT
jgi:hypothetical protein